MLFGLFSSMTVSSSRSGNAISSPEMIWEPLIPDIEAFPALREPFMSRGTKTSEAALATEAELPAEREALSPAFD